MKNITKTKMSLDEGGITIKGIDVHISIPLTLSDNNGVIMHPHKWTNE